MGKPGNSVWLDEEPQPARTDFFKALHKASIQLSVNFAVEAYDWWKEEGPMKDSKMMVVAKMVENTELDIPEAVKEVTLGYYSHTLECQLYPMDIEGKEPNPNAPVKDEEFAALSDYLKHDEEITQAMRKLGFRATGEMTYSGVRKWENKKVWVADWVLKDHHVQMTYLWPNVKYTAEEMRAITQQNLDRLPEAERLSEMQRVIDMCA